MILGITGGSGCGKTTLLNLIQTRGGAVIDCDAVYHELLKTDTALLQAIEARFPGVVTDGALDRKKLGAIVFADESALTDLNTITHAAVGNAVKAMLPPPPALAAIDAIALFESGLSGLCDVTVAVTAPLEDRVARLMKRDSISESYARSRIAAQHEDGWFRERCGYTLENDGDVNTFLSKCVAFLDTLGIMDL